ncbi:TlpA family protein disulfide reductase [Flavivirga rizhaonensis]|nr:TlpA disulfide reductase family protein [Flavivirga rizhaonensis]
MTFNIMILVALLTSCNQKTIDYAILSGNVKNSDNTKITIYGVSKTETANYLKEIEVDQNGIFSDTIYLKTPGHYIFFNEYIYIEPGNNLNVSFDAKRPRETQKYSGNGAVINNYLVAKRLKEKELIPKRSEYAKLDETKYIALFSNMKSELQKLLASLKQTHPKFYESELKNLEYDYLYKLYSYESYHRAFTDNKTFKPSAKITDILNTIDYDNALDYGFSGAYRLLSLRNFLNYDFYPQVTDLDHKDTIAKVFSAIKSLKSENIKNGLASDMKKFMNPTIENIEALNTGIMEMVTDSITRVEVIEKYNIAKRLTKGQKAPSFSYENFKGGTTSLDDLKGTYVYIDMWATWCGPCKRQIPFLEKIEKQYHDKNIAFVSISIDSDKEAWKKFVADKQLGGIQLLAEGAWKASVMTDYDIDGVPRFMLFDPEGKIVTVNAPLPSDPELSEILDNLLIEKI